VSAKAVEFGDMNEPGSTVSNCTKPPGRSTVLLYLCTYEIRYVEDEKEGSICHLEWQFFDPTHVREDLSLGIHLDTDQKAFTYVKAFADTNDELVVKAYGYSADEIRWKYPTLKEGLKETDKRRSAEKWLSKEGQFSPSAHVKGDVLDPLIKIIGRRRRPISNQ
ncbi:hypothetical protein FOZ61_010340, partial [Perkinsus olseni]